MNQWNKQTSGSGAQHHASQPVELDAVFVNEGPLAGGFIARDSSKPGRVTQGEVRDVWIVHAGEAYSVEHLEAPAHDMEERLLSEMIRALELEPGRPSGSFAHRWRFARPRVLEPQASGCLLDDDVDVGWAGDWLEGGRIEGAMRSGKAAAEAIASRLRSTAKQ